ncbi:hypothetical protein ABZ371_04460 [Streptomyces sp. NPDC005899]|uniref:hypothetical protein n=1 Tax=Streptomyces sp. NPDC005899 TaxID=3155716 RepID=UPI0033C1566A
MGVDVVLTRVTRRGTSPAKRQLTTVGVVQDEADLFAGLCVSSRLPMLNRVDPYRTRVLTSADMPQFIAEIDATGGLVEGPRERSLLARIRELAERCAEAGSLELHLHGD